MSQIELAVTLSRRLETLLEQKYQAVGKGLHEKVSSVEGRLPSELVKTLRYIATMRNSVVHEEGFVIKDENGFRARGDAALAQLGGACLARSGDWTPVHISNWSFGDWVKMTIMFVSLIAGTVLGVKFIGGWIGAVVGFLLGLSFSGMFVGRPK